MRLTPGEQSRNSPVAVKVVYHSNQYTRITYRSIMLVALATFVAHTAIPGAMFVLPTMLSNG
jgi:hypothetical protein